MIPKRSDTVPLSMDGVNAGVLTPKAESPAGSPAMETVVVPANSASAILDALRRFANVTRTGVIPASQLDQLVKKDLVVVVEGYAVVSPKGLRYLVDFNLLT